MSSSASAPVRSSPRRWSARWRRTLSSSRWRCRSRRSVPKRPGQAERRWSRRGGRTTRTRWTSRWSSRASSAACWTAGPGTFASAPFATQPRPLRRWFAPTSCTRTSSSPGPSTSGSRPPLRRRSCGLRWSPARPGERCHRRQSRRRPAATSTRAGCCPAAPARVLKARPSGRKRSSCESGTAGFWRSAARFRSGTSTC